MNDQNPDPRFFVVGGALQPGRDCYLQRVADAELYEHLCDGDYAHVLAQRQAGKTSLAAATAAKLRARDIAVAVVDLTRTSAEDPSENAGRWYYSIAYRIVRDLRIRADVQTWWAERGGLTNLQRLREFFQEIVLQESTGPAVIFFDRVEATLGEPLAQDLFASIRACHDARATNPEFNRLTFALLGSAAPGELVSKSQLSPFPVSTAIHMADFSPQEMSGLLAGLGEPPAEAEAVAARVWSWTRGHPYLSQKVFRGLARRKENLNAAAVDELIQMQFLAPHTLRDEPHILAIAERMLVDTAGRTARLNLYGRIRKGVEVISDPVPAAQRELLMAGVITVGEDDELRVRNEIYAMVFSTRWINQNLPYGLRSIAIVVAILACILAVPVWYTEYLPRPYLQALSANNQDFLVAADAYENLARFPGYGNIANRMYESFLVRMSSQTIELSQAMQINGRLAILPGGTERGTGLLADFWERKAITLKHAGDRDRALVAFLESLQQPSGQRRRLAAELAGKDYTQLLGTVHSREAVREVRVDPANALLTVLDTANNVDLWRLEAGGVVAVGMQQLVAEERLQLEQRRVYDQLPVDPRLLIEINHAHPGQVELQLRAPSGQQALLSLSAGTMVREGVFAFDFGRYAELKKLLVAERSGNWTLVLTDLEAGTAGDTLGWSIVDTKTRELEAAYRVLQPVPEPRTTVNAISRLSKDGRLGLSWPANSSTAGPILVWDIAADAVLARVPRNPDTLEALFVMDGSRVLTITSTQLVLWDSQSGRRVGQIKLDEPLSASITLAPNERYAALPARRKDKTRVVDVWDLKKMQRIGRVVAAADARKLAIDSSGNHLAIGGRDAWVRVWSMQSGELVREFAHSAPLRSLQFDQQGDWLATDDLSSTLRIWNVQSGRVPLIERVGNSAWNIHFANDSGSVLFGSYDRAYQVVSLPDGRDAGVRLRHPAVGHIGREAGGEQRVFVLSELQLAITSDTNRNVKVWKLPATLPATQISKLMPGNMRTALSPDGQRIAAGATVADVRIHAAGAPGSLLLDAISDARPEEAGAVSSEIVRLVFSPDRSLLASGSMDGIVRLWESASGRRLSLSVLHPDGPVHDLLFSADGNLLFSASRLEVQVTDLLVGETIARLRIQADNPQLALAGEATELFIADDQNGVTRWNWKDSISDRIVSGDYQVRKIAVAPDGSRLITAGADLSLRLWDVANGVLVEQSMTAAGKVDDLWLVGDGKRLIVHAGHWLHSVIVSSAGLAPRHTRFLDAVPAAVQPDAAGIEVYMLLPSPLRPTLGRLALADPPEVEMAGEPEQLRDYWRARLALSLQPGGQVQPVLMAAPLARP